MTALAKVIKSCHSLEELDLSYNAINYHWSNMLGAAYAVACARKADAPQPVAKLRRLNLAHNQISNEGAFGLASALAKVKCPLTHLDVRSNNI